MTSRTPALLPAVLSYYAAEYVLESTTVAERLAMQVLEDFPMGIAIEGVPVDGDYISCALAYTAVAHDVLESLTDAEALTRLEGRFYIRQMHVGKPSRAYDVHDVFGLVRPALAGVSMKDIPTVAEYLSGGEYRPGRFSLGDESVSYRDAYFVVAQDLLTAMYTEGEVERNGDRYRLEPWKGSQLRVVK